MARNSIDGVYEAGADQAVTAILVLAGGVLGLLLLGMLMLRRIARLSVRSEHREMLSW